MTRTPRLARALALAVAALLPLAAGAGEKSPQTRPLPPDLALVPPDGVFFLSVEVAKALNGPDGASVKKVSAAHPLVITSELKNLETQYGLKPEAIERFVAIAPDPLGMVMLVTGAVPFDRETVIGKLAPGATEEKVAGRSFYAGGAADPAVGFVDPRTLALGSPRSVKELLKRKEADGAAAGYGGAVKAAAGRPLMAAALNPLLIRSGVKNAGPLAEPFLPLVEASAWSLTATAEKGLRLTIHGDFADEAAAKKAAAALGTALPLIDGFLGMAGQRMPEMLKKEAAQHPGAKDLAGRMTKAIEATRAGLKDAAAPRADGKAVETTIQIETDEPATTAVLLMSLMPRAKKR